MSTNTKLFISLNLLVAMIVVVACGVQSGQAAQYSPQIETQMEGSVTEEHHHEDEHEHDEAAELSAVDLAEGERLKVVATTDIVGDLVHNVAGDMIELTNMLPTGTDPHTFTPTPQDATAVADAHVIFINGLHLEEFLAELIENAGGDASLVVLSANVETREFEEMEGDSEDAHDEDEHGHAHRGVDPHIWMTPANAIVMVHNIEHALRELDPANAGIYEANAQDYEAQLEELDDWVKSQIETIPAKNRKLVTDHDALGYYAARYGLEIIGTVIPAYSTNAEPSARELANLQEAIEAFGTKVVFVGTSVNTVLAERVAEDMGIELVSLYTGSLGEPGSGAETYIDFIRYNTTVIADALK